MSEKRAPIGDMLFKGALIFNPVLVQIVGICPVVAASTSVATSALMALVFSAEMIITCVIASAAMKDIKRYIRVALYLIFGLAIVCPIMYLLESRAGVVFSVSTTIYLPLIAINSVTALHCEKFSVRNSVRDSFADALAVSIGYSGVFILVGAIREYLGSGTVAGYALPVAHKLSGMLMPFGSLIILGYLAMALKWYISKAHPEYIDETIMKIQNTSFKIKRESPPPVKIAEPEPQAAPEVIAEPAAEQASAEETPSSQEPPQEAEPAAEEQEAPKEQPAQAQSAQPEPSSEPSEPAEPPVGVVVPEDAKQRHNAYSEIEKLSKEHDAYLTDKDKSLEDLIKSLENDIEKIRITEPGDEENSEGEGNE